MGRGPSGFPEYQVCIQVRDGSGAKILTTRCGTELQSANPGDLIVTMSGGAQGAPGFAPSEAFVAGLVPRGVERVAVRLQSAPQRDVAVRDSGFMFVTSNPIQAVVFQGAGTFDYQPLNACQHC
jgi:hypothetical protein